MPKVLTPDAFLFVALAQMHALYIYGAKGPERFDCSGLVTFSLYTAGGPDWRATHNTAKLLQLPPVPEEQVRAGDLVMYRGHVMIYVTPGLVLGACGGDETTTTPEEARRRGAKVQLRKGLDYRPGRLGFRRLPFAE